MINELEIDDGLEIESAKVKTSRYQVLTAVRLKSYRQWGYLERNEMKNPVYYRMMKDGHFVGFKRIVTEYLPVAATRWQLDPMDHDENATQILSQPAMGIVTLGREKISSSGKQRRVTHPKSKVQNEPTPVSSSGELTD